MAKPSAVYQAWLESWGYWGVPPKISDLYEDELNSYESFKAGWKAAKEHTEQQEVLSDN